MQQVSWNRGERVRVIKSVHARQECHACALCCILVQAHCACPCAAQVPYVQPETNAQLTAAHLASACELVWRAHWGAAEQRP